ncbi:hypothetical protein DACRYDRAFT_80789 [Dacryopinax primogenitus]|uniref:Conserved oligomeric Golgi complex subunit 7 n=1 Tax=Dacryopinax primogenitus (strain DJM 731) TaxID=1858805 RepID=M5FW33_DACPD|nr:uncharacterized protein DACRYDRAFT_80789 [Dacryopinax primogenitus]EJU00574.1 hypothetical protein DACRYDRAFT_80789 [Dacryopinax primogenitus]
MASPLRVVSPAAVNGADADLDNEAPLTIRSSDLIASLDEYDGDVVGWINDLLDGPAQADGAQKASPLPLSEVDKRVNQLSRRLEITSQDTAVQLERSIDDITRAVPRLTYDLQFMRESAISLRLSLETLQTRSNLQIAGTQTEETTKALEVLQYLDTVKTRMEASLEVLREAESWSTLESEVTALIAEQQYDRASDRLAEANKSMPLFQNTPEYESRRALMVSLQNQLEASLSSALVAAINSRDTHACKTFYSIFTRIQRESEFRNYYYGSRRSNLVSMWQRTPLSDCAEETVVLDAAGLDITPQQTAAPIKFSQFLSRFFTEFLIILNEERTYIPAIFPDPQYTLSAFIQSLFDALNPSLPQRLSAISEFYGAKALPELIETFRSTESLAVEIEKIMEKVGNSAFFAGTGDEHHRPPLSGAQKRSSKRMSISRRMGPGRASISLLPGQIPSSIAPWEQSLFEPFTEFQNEYGTLERAFLENNYRAASKRARAAATEGDKPVDMARLVRAQSAEVFSLAEDAMSRCMILTHGYGGAALVTVLDYLFGLFLDGCRSNVTALRKPPTGVPTPQLGTEPPDIDYTTEDWNVFQLGLHLLETCRAIKERLNVLENRLRNSMGQISTALRLARVDPASHPLPGTTSGEALILAQSGLNSLSLQGLLDLLEKPAASRPHVLDGANSAIVALTKSCQTLLQNIILLPLHAHLVGYPFLPVWAATKDQRNKGAFDLNIPTFSLSPTPIIARVAEGLLNLPRLFEVYADDDALAFSIETLPFVDAESLNALGQDDQIGEPLSRVPSHLSGTAPPSEAPTQTQAPIVLSAEIVSSTWLSSLALSLVAHLTADILPTIVLLSSAGAAQLASDLSYLSNIVRALNVEWDDLERWKELSELSDDEGKERLGLAPLEEQDAPMKSIAKMRRWTS